MSSTELGDQAPSEPYVHPFTKATADVILRSCDGDDFRVHKLILCEASLFFEDMFLLPQSGEGAAGSTSTDGLAIIQVSETSRTLDHLLRFCYPTANPSPCTVAEVAAIIDAARKYQMDEVLLDARPLLIHARFLDAGADGKHSLTAYAAAWRLDLEAEREAAARASLRHDVRGFADVDIGAAALLDLMQFRTRCVAAATAFVSRPDEWTVLVWRVREQSAGYAAWLDVAPFSNGSGRMAYGCFECGCPAPRRVGIPRYNPTCALRLNDPGILDEFARIVQHRPCGAALRESTALRRRVLNEDVEKGDRSRTLECGKCVASGLEIAKHLLEHLATDLDRVVAQVPFDRDDEPELEEENYTFYPVV